MHQVPDCEECGGPCRERERLAWAGKRRSPDKFTFKQTVALLQIVLGVPAFVLALALGEAVLAFVQAGAVYWAWAWLMESMRGGVGP